MLPVIALVGRPNVGKSTLFNRFTHSRDALVSSLPGMTRDRQYGKALLNDKPYILIDTGGITDEKNHIDALTTSQSLQAIQEADHVIFVVDAKSGPTNDDLLIARMLRKSKKEIYLALNKTESLNTELVSADFFKFGMGTPFPCSAAHGSGIKAIIQAILNKDNNTTVNSTDREFNLPKRGDSIRLTIAGRPNVGKSTLTNRMLGESRVIVSDIPGTTRDSIITPLTRENQNYTLVDTAGVRRKGKVYEVCEKFSVVKTLQSIEATDVTLLLMDATETITDQDLRLLGFILNNHKALVVAINKWDGQEINQREHIKSEISRRLAFIPFVRIHFISALHGTGVGNLFDSIKEAYKSAAKKLTTPQLNQIIKEATIKHQPPRINSRRVKLRYAHSGGNFPPCIVIHGNQVEKLPDSYKRYLMSTFQDKLKLTGTPVKLELKNSDNPFKDKKNNTKKSPFKKNQQKAPLKKKNSLRKNTKKRKST